MDTILRPSEMPRRVRMAALLLLSLVLLPACTTKTISRGDDTLQGSPFQIEQARAMSLLVEGRLDRAEEGFQRAQKAASNGTEEALARTGLGGVELKRQNYSKADRLLEEAIKKEPRTTDAWIFLAGSKLAQGDTLAAISTLQEGRLQTEGSPEVEAYLGIVYLDWGAPVQAAMHLERALDKAPSRKAWLDALRQAQGEAGLGPPETEISSVGEADSLQTSADSPAAEPLREGDEGVRPQAASDPARVAGGAAAVVGDSTIEPSSEMLRKYRERADQLVEASRLTRIDLSVLLAMHGPTISPWPGLGDLPEDLRDHEFAEAAGVVLFAGWMERFPDGRFYPDDPLNRAQTALLIYPQIRRYPALARRARLKRIEPLDVPLDHYAYLEITAVVSSGLMELDAAGNFRPNDPLSGAAADHLARHLARALEDGLSGFDEEAESVPAAPGAP